MSSGEPRVLIVRLSAVGDCLLTLPMACAIKDRWPSSRITWVVERAAAPLLRGHAAIDHLIELPKRWLKSPLAVWRLRRELRRERFDIALDPQSLSKSAMVSWLSGTRHRVGLARPIGRELSLVLNNDRHAAIALHVVDRQLEMLKSLDVTPTTPRFDVPVCSQSTEQVDQWLDDPRLTPAFAVVNPGASWDSKLWPPERLGRVAAYMGESYGLPSLVVWAGDRERGWAQEVTRQSDGYALIAPPTTFPELAAVLRRARIMISADTGPMHLAAVVGTPCVALFGTTRVEVSGPYGPQHVRLQAYYQDGSSRERRRADNDAMRAISVESVCRAVDQILAPKATKRAA